ncbi:21537_t:CDS:2, partial [Racocetra persica]
TGEEEKEVKIFYDAIEYALKDELLEKQRKEKLLLLKETPPEIIKSVVLMVNSLHANKKLVTSHKKEKIQDITTNILNLKRSVEKHDTYQDIYNILDELVLKPDYNDYNLLNIEVIDITSKWASKFKDTMVNFAKKLELEEDLVEESSLGHWVETLESQKKCSQCIVKCLNNIWKLSMDWNKNSPRETF